MILLPTRGVAGQQPAVKRHRIEIDVFADWIEASVLFEDIAVSITDVVCVLLEEELYEDQDFARDMVQSAWLEIEQRGKRSSGHYGVTIEGNWARASVENTTKIAHRFLLTLSLATYYDWWHNTFGPNYTTQGKLFESLTEMALKALTPGWSIFSTGWKGDISDSDFLAIADQVAICLNTDPVIKHKWDLERAKDLTLDLLVYWPFSDSRQGVPYIMIQCASGRNWDDKLKDPDIDQWRKLLNPDCLPLRGVSIPFCLPDNRFRKASAKTAGLLLDRCRILFAARQEIDWMNEMLKDEINVWMKPRIAELLKRSS
jgi:hypothetical protein